MIEAAIEQYYIQPDKDGMLMLMESMVSVMQQEGEFLVPYITADESVCVINI